MRLLLTFLALLTGLSAAPAQARMCSAESSEIERVEGSSRPGASAIAAAVADMGSQTVQRRRRGRDTTRPRATASRVIIPSIQYGDRARE
ncbi:MAG: hypothetical protein ABW194_05115 [Novosphingobium sp.]